MSNIKEDLSKYSLAEVARYFAEQGFTILTSSPTVDGDSKRILRHTIYSLGQKTISSFDSEVVIQEYKKINKSNAE